MGEESEDTGINETLLANRKPTYHQTFADKKKEKNKETEERGNAVTKSQQKNNYVPDGIDPGMLTNTKSIIDKDQNLIDKEEIEIKKLVKTNEGKMNAKDVEETNPEEEKKNPNFNEIVPVSDKRQYIKGIPLKIKS